MRTWLSWAWPAASLAAIAAACGGGNGTSGGFAPDGGETGDGASSSGAGSSGSSSGVSGGSSGDDAASSSSSGGGSSSGPGDATLDIAFPDVFTHPDSSSGSGSSSSSGGDGSMPCSPNGITCSGSVANDCNNGTLTSTDCSALNPPQQCANGYGCVACIPGTGFCLGNTGSQCNGNGTGYITNSCDPLLGETCDGATGQCDGDCANVGSSYIGCEYYAVTMSNTELNQSVFFYSVSISNTSTKSATITITGPSYNQTFTLAGGAIQNYQLPWVSSVSCTGGGCNGNLAPTPSTVRVAGGAYHIKSTEPVTVYQFNAYDYTLSSNYSFTNDASLLIPVNALTGNYRVVSGKTWGLETDEPSCSGSLTKIQEPAIIDVIGIQPNTSVQFNVASGQIIAGAGLGTSGGTATLGPGDVLQIASAQDAPYSTTCGATPAGCTCIGGFGSDMSGATITASAPVLVVGGSDCTFMPANQWACDHIEEINFPLETLGTDYLVTLPYNKNAPQSAGSPSWGRQFVKVVGTANGTVLAADPPQAGLTSTISAGQVVWFETTSHFHLTASHPVIVGQFMESEYNFGTACQGSSAGTGPQDCGDPALSLGVATAQFRTSYQFIAPPSYSENWVNVIAPNGATVQVDGATVSGYSPIGSASGYQVAHVALCSGGACTGVHSATSSSPFGIEVYGYGVYTSYMYPGGLNLNRQ